MDKYTPLQTKILNACVGYKAAEIVHAFELLKLKIYMPQTEVHNERRK